MRCLLSSEQALAFYPTLPQQEQQEQQEPMDDMVDMVELKKLATGRSANEQLLPLLSAVLDDSDLLTLILSKVDKWSDELPCLSLGRSRQVCKQWNELGLHELVRASYCEAMDWKAMPRWCSSQHRLPKCGNSACSYVHRNHYWKDFRAFCPSCTLTTILPPMPATPIIPAVPDGKLLWRIHEEITPVGGCKKIWQIRQFIKEEDPFEAGKFKFVEVYMGKKRTSESDSMLRRPIWARLVGLRKYLNPGETYVVSTRFRLRDCECHAAANAERLTINPNPNPTEDEIGKKQLQQCVTSTFCEWTPWSDFSDEVTVVAAPEELD